MYPSATNREKNASFSCRRASASCSPAHFTPSPTLADKSAASTFSTYSGLSGGWDSRFQIARGSVHCPFAGLHSAFRRALGLGGGSSQATSGRKKRPPSKGSPASRPRLTAAREALRGSLVHSERRGYIWVGLGLSSVDAAWRQTTGFSASATSLVRARLHN